MKSLVIVAFVTLVLVGCETQPKVDPNAPKSEEWEQCIADVEKYAECTTRAASGLPGGAGSRVAKQMESKSNSASASEAMCTKIRGKIPADDSCAP